MEKPADDGFHWFGEGFNGFPKSLPDDCVEYSIYIIDSKLNDLQLRDNLRKVQSGAQKLTNELTKGFIWQRDAFNLTLQRDRGNSFLRGHTNFGDSVEDEWLVVYILRELSLSFPQTWIRTVDTDGEFLLIEAAGVLPRWLNPEVADHRVWLNSGKLLIIDPNDSATKAGYVTSETKSLTLVEAFGIIENRPSGIIHRKNIQAEAFRRLERFPNQIHESLHYACVQVPRKLAYILHQNPTHISPAVEAFYLRDPIALRPLQAHDDTDLMFPPKDLVRISAKFTKIGYAQLKSQQFDPPQAWSEVSSTVSNRRSHEEIRTGMKLTSGFEMLVLDPQQQDRKAVREIQLLLEDLKSEEGSLPSDAEIRQWSMQEDDEKWLEIDFEEFNQELGGKPTKPATHQEARGFGDKGTYENLQRIVERFETIMHDDALDTESLDDMDEDDDTDSEAEENDVSTDETVDATHKRDVSFDETAFTQMMAELMGKSTDTELTDVNFSEKEDTEIHENMLVIEKELHETGTLQLNLRQIHDKSIPSLSKVADAESGDLAPPIKSINGKGSESREEEGVDIDIDYNHVKSLLESLKNREAS